MASKRAHTSSTVTTTEGGKLKTLVLRTKLEDLGESTSSDMLWELSRLQFKLKQARPEEREGIIDEIISLFKTQMNQRLDDVGQEVKSHEPKEPQREKGQSEEDFKKATEEYQAALQNYKAYEAEAMKLIERVMEVIFKALKAVEDFCDPLWEMIQNEDKDIDAKVRSFVDKVITDIKKGLLEAVKSMSDE